MSLLKELINMTESQDKPKKDKKDKSADKYLNKVAGNMVMHSVCSGSDAGSIKTKNKS